MRTIRVLIGASLLSATAYLCQRGAGQLPPLGPLLDPRSGMWGLARAARPLAGSIGLDIFERPVEVVMDRRGVPHIFAETTLDAYRALGYVVARDRLFQLELQTRAASGRLTEWIGRAGLESDRQARFLGFPELVAKTIRAADTTAPGYRSIVAYGQGVSAWIARMKPADLPLEYRLLRRRPEAWTSANTFFLLGRMSLTLALNDPTFTKATAAGRVGWPAADALFPVNAPIQEPIQPNGRTAPRLTAAIIPPPGVGDPRAARVAEAARYLTSGRGTSDAVLGSNNWAVSPGRAAGRHALLAGDPHLDLSLPSVWYQAHLVVRDTLDVQGVTLPGAPWIIIGFNRDIAWSFTNTGADVNDFFRETVDDSVRPSRYLVDGAWRDLTVRMDAFLGRNGDTLAIDTTRRSHRGPLLRAGNEWVSMGWTVYEGQSGADQFAAVNRARSAGEMLTAMRGFVAPAQNMLVADRAGTIAIRSTGKFPIREARRGDSLLDGSRSTSDWRAALPTEYYPFALNPAQGFLASANQQPVDPETNGRYFGADWPPPWRAIRINALLRADSAVTPERMQAFQTDRVSARALGFLPFLLDSAVRPLSESAAPVEAARDLLRSWNGAYERDDRHAVLFEAVMRELSRLTWDELIPAGASSDSALPNPRPNDAALFALLHDPDNPWWDDRRTAGRRERRDDIVLAALASGLERTRRDRGADPSSVNWRWDAVHHANIFHLLRIPALSALELPVDAGPSTLNPSSGRGTAGASWRMVVELAPDVRAWATYPGGQSGNPGSPHYDDLLAVWRAGRLDRLTMPRESGQMTAADVESRLIFSARR